MVGVKVGVPVAIVAVLLAIVGAFLFRRHRKSKRTKAGAVEGSGEEKRGRIFGSRDEKKRGLFGFKNDKKGDPPGYAAEMDDTQKVDNPVGELEVPPTEMAHNDAPRHELG